MAAWRSINGISIMASWRKRIGGGQHQQRVAAAAATRQREDINGEIAGVAKMKISLAAKA